ncbi:PLP-dependent aminotransferase family protein [Oceanobacillus sp. AG]|uniref:MocR-like pyridoxine biosynthesis transcription factor PdxR n=1 Tax=Oceanobacillus sp. AG TaxID=2681969 RepID=UPI0012EBD18C|nr:PLP-dependent aminotransferase family protein [Oceanobacillus sp. AG]
MNMLTCHLERESEIPLYEQLYNFIKKEIMEGRITYGSKLPSKRKLADFLKISQNTIEQAYDQLVAEGYIEAKPRKGYFVLASEDLEYVQPARTIQEYQIEKKQIRYDFHPSWIDTEHFPFAKWRKYAKDIITKDNQELLLMGDPQGELHLREEIATYIYQARGVQCSPDDIILGAGIETLLQQFILLMGSKTTYGVEDPGYHVMSRMLKHYPNKVYPLQVDNDGVKIGELERTPIDIMYVTPSRQFPFGSVLSANRRIKLLNWATEKDDRYIIEDDYDSEFRYTGKSIPSLQSLDQNEKVVYLGTFSKSLIPSIRISYMVLPKHLMKFHRKKLSYFQCSVSRIDQHILAQFMKEGDFERHLNRMRNVYRRKMELTLETLASYQDFVEVIGDLSGFHVVLKIKNGMSEATLVEKAYQADLKIYPLSFYVMEEQFGTEPIILLGFASIPETELEEAIQLLMGCWETQK